LYVLPFNNFIIAEPLNNTPRQPNMNSPFMFIISGLISLVIASNIITKDVAIINEALIRDANNE